VVFVVLNICGGTEANVAVRLGGVPTKIRIDTFEIQVRSVTASANSFLTIPLFKNTCVIIIIHFVFLLFASRTQNFLAA
jgi:hypothetical protein